MDIEAQDLTKDFSGTVALNHLTLKFEGPGLLGYLGPNGAGKTTTLKLFTGLLRPTAGKAVVNGRVVADDQKKALEETSAIIESPEPYPHQTIREYLSFIARIRGIGMQEAMERIKRLEEKISLEDLGKRCGRLSKGHKQRVILAAALLPDPAILFLDEPTNGLDPAEARDIRYLLAGLKKSKLIFMSSHLLYEVTEICDRVAFINKGKLLLTDTIQGITTKYSEMKGVEGLEDAYVKLIRGT